MLHTYPTKMLPATMWMILSWISRVPSCYITVYKPDVHQISRQSNTFMFLALMLCADHWKFSMVLLTVGCWFGLGVQSSEGCLTCKVGDVDKQSCVLQDKPAQQVRRHQSIYFTVQAAVGKIGITRCTGIASQLFGYFLALPHNLALLTTGK